MESCIILLFNSNYKRRLIGVIFLQDKHNINAKTCCKTTTNILYILSKPHRWWTGQRACNAGFRTNEALCQLSYEAPYLSPEGGRPGSPDPTQAVGIAPEQNAFKFKIAPSKQKSIVKHFFDRKMPPPPGKWGFVLKHT